MSFKVSTVQDFLTDSQSHLTSAPPGGVNRYFILSFFSVESNYYLVLCKCYHRFRNSCSAQISAVSKEMTYGLWGERSPDYRDPVPLIPAECVRERRETKPSMSTQRSAASVNVNASPLFARTSTRMERGD